MTNKEKYMLNKSNMENKYNLKVGDIIIAKGQLPTTKSSGLE